MKDYALFEKRIIKNKWWVVCIFQKFSEKNVWPVNLKLVLIILKEYRIRFDQIMIPGGSMVPFTKGIIKIFKKIVLQKSCHLCGSILRYHRFKFTQTNTQGLGWATMGEGGGDFFLIRIYRVKTSSQKPIDQ